MSRTDIESVTPYLLQAVPEIRDGYARMEREAYDVPISEEDAEEIRLIEQMNDLPQTDDRLPGVTTVMETLLVPYIIDLASKNRNPFRLKQIMDWLESLARNDDFEIRNLVGVAVCEPLITNYEQHIAEVYPYIGEAMKVMCRDSFSAFRVDASTKKLFGVV